MNASFAFFGPLGGWEVLIIAIVGLLIFGKRLPEVGRSLGKGIVEFKKGLQGIEDDVNKAGRSVGGDTPKKIDQDPGPAGNDSPPTDRPA